MGEGYKLKTNCAPLCVSAVSYSFWDFLLFEGPGIDPLNHLSNFLRG